MANPPRYGKGGWADVRKLPKGPNGRNLCRQCGTEVPTNRRTFCGDDCVHKWKMEKDPTYIAKLVLKRDKGICAICQKDCVALRKYLFSLRGQAQQEAYKEHDTPLHRNRMWDVDHIVPVVEGGGSCGLENLRTLCVSCHKRVTKELAAKRAEERRKSKVPDKSD